MKEVFDMQTKLTSIRETLPQPNKSEDLPCVKVLTPVLFYSLFLRSIVGSINVTIPNGEDK